MIGFIFTLIVAAIVGIIGDALTKHDMPGGIVGSIIAGFVGSWLGGFLPIFRNLGPRIGNIAVIPAILGAALFIFILGMFRTNRHRRRT